MSATTVDINYKTRDRGRQRYLLKNAVQVYRGSLIIFKPATGYADKLTDASGHVFKGLAVKAALGDTGATPVAEVIVDETGVVLEQVTVTGASAITDPHAKVYATDDQTLTLTPTTYLRAVGRVVKWYSSTTCDVQLFTPEEYAAQTLAADIAALTDNSGGATADGTIGAIAATAAATAGGATPTAGQVDTGIATAVASIVTGANDAIKELATKVNLILAALNLQQ